MIEDIMSIIRKGPQLASQLDALKLNTKSVAHGASDATFQFPCLFEDTLPVEMMGAISRKTELTYAAFTQIWLSLNPMIDITKDRSIVQYLKKYHQNIKVESVMNDLLVPENEVKGYMESVRKGDYSLYLAPDKKFGVLFNIRDRGTRAMMESHRDFLRDHLSDFDTTMVPIITEADSNFIGQQDFMQAALNSEKQKKQDFASKTSADIWKNRRPASIINANDVKKTNDMMPYAMEVRLMAVNDKNQFVQYMDFVVGVKTIIHPIKSDELVVNIVRVMKNRDPLFKFLRWTSGEISLFKNIIFNLDEIRSDAFDRQKGRNPWFAKLKHLKSQKLGLHNITIPHGVIPNATMVISSYTADYIKETYAIDLRNPTEARRLSSVLFLMGFMIVDDGAGIIDILYDDGSGFQTYTLESLERDISMNSNKLGREIGRMIAH